MAPKPIQTDTSREVFAQAPGGPSQSRQIAGLENYIAAPYEGLSKMGGELSDLGEKLAAPAMEEKGSKAVTRDPTTGELGVELRTPLNSMDVAYNHAAKASYMAQSSGDTRLALQKLALDNTDDPEKFRQLATTYVKQLAGGKGVPPELRGDILNTGIEDVTQFTYGLTSQKQARDTRNQLGEIRSNIESGWNDVLALAHNGGTDTPDFQQALGKVQNMYGAMRNPVFGVTPEQIQNEISEKLGAAEGEAALGHSLAEAKANGLQAGLDFAEKTIWDPKLNLTPAQRESYQSRAHRELGEWDALNRDAVVQLKQQVDQRLDDAYSKAERTGKWDDVVSSGEIARAYAKDPAKGADIISRLNAGAMTYSMRKQVLGATPANIAAMDARLDPAKNPQPNRGFDSFYSEFLAGHEGGYTAADGNGHPANFGVNQGANPDVDVASLSQDQAKTLLHDRYWTASGADQLPAALAAVQGDTAVNMGVGASKDLLAKSGGDPQKYLDLRAQRYKDIAAGNPDKAKDLPTWLARNEDLRNYIAGGGFADRERTYTAFQKAVHERNEALTKDPAGFTGSARPDIGGLLASNDPTTFQTGLRNSLMAQRDMGVNAPKVLATTQTAALVQQFNNPPDPTKRADHMLGIIVGLEQKFGKYFPQAMGELQKAGMPAEAFALAQVKDDPAVAWRMTNAVNAGRATLKKVTPDADVIDKAVVSSLAPFNKTLAGQSGNSKAAAQQVEAAQLYAYQLASEGVPNPGKRAAQDLIGKRYTFAESYRVPTGIDPDAVQSGARQLLYELPASAVMAEGSLHDPHMTPETRQTMSSQILHSRGVWLTMPDDSGLYLAYPQETGFVPGRLTNGKAISFTWPQLTAKALKVTKGDVTAAQLGTLQ